jgi:hypothetical protein
MKIAPHARAAVSSASISRPHVQDALNLWRNGECPRPHRPRAFTPWGAALRRGWIAERHAAIRASWAGSRWPSTHHQRHHRRGHAALGDRLPSRASCAGSAPRGLEPVLASSISWPSRSRHSSPWPRSSRPIVPTAPLHLHELVKILTTRTSPCPPGPAPTAAPAPLPSRQGGQDGLVASSPPPPRRRRPVQVRPASPWSPAAAAPTPGPQVIPSSSSVPYERMD